MHLSSGQQADINLSTYFIPKWMRAVTEADIKEYLAFSERGTQPVNGAFSSGPNPLIIGKARRGLTMRQWEEGNREGTFPYVSLLLGNNGKPIPRYVVDFMKKEMFKGTHSYLIESTYKELCA